jgi:predicted PurR-regulated permease PerM
MRRLVFRVFFFAVFLYLLYELMHILAPFFTALLAATTLTLIFYPVHARILRTFPTRPTLAATLSTAAILLIVIVPVSLFVWLLIKQSGAFYPFAKEWAQSIKAGGAASFAASLPPSVQPLWERIDSYLTLWQIDPEDIFLKNVDLITGKISTFGTRIVRNLVLLGFDLAVTAFSLFFMFRDGRATVRRVVALIPMEQLHKEQVVTRLDRTLSAVVRGVFITAAVQGLLAGVGFAVAGLQFSVLLGFTTAFLAPIPFVGAAAVWVPVCLFLFLKGSVVKAALLTLWCLGVVSTVDNFLRPILIGEKAKLPVFLLFFGILGGLQAYGFIGILLGPLMIASLLAFAKIYREQFPASTPDAPPPAP